MAKKYLVGVDLGTSATKAALYTQDGVLAAEATEPVAIYTPQPGVVEQENEDFYRTAARTVSTCLRESGIDPRAVAAITFDSQMAGIGALGEHFKPAARFDSWLDMRCKPYIEWIQQEYGDRVTELTGCPPTCDHGAKMLWWKHEQPEVYRHTAKFVTPAGYVAGRIAGLKPEQAFMDYTFIHFSGFSDAQAGQWSAELCDRLGMDPEKLPEIVDPWKVIGEVSGVAAADLGLAAGTPVTAGAGDTAAGALGAGIVRHGMLFDTAGTAAVLAGCTNQYVADVGNRALLTMRSVIPGLWNPLAYIAGGGLVHRWMRDTFFNVMRAGQSDDLYAAMAELAAQAPSGADGLFFSPHLGGRICPSDPDMRGAWMGFSWGHTQAHFIRAAMESVAFEYAYYLRILRALIDDLELVEARVIGGGARNHFWNQVKADVLGVPYQRLKRQEFATWGCALIGGYAVGLFNNLADAAEAAVERDGGAVLPDAENHALYRPLVDCYIQWQKVLPGAFEAMDSHSQNKRNHP
jgi:xylulokinase